MGKPLLLVDFDRTLFDTGLFVDALWSALADLYHVDKDLELVRAKEFYEYQGDWYDYDFYRHLGTIDVIPSDRAVFEAALHERLADDSFLFADADGLVGSIDAIVTFGNEPYQRFKLSFCPRLKHVTTYIIQTGKGEFIQRQFGEQPTVLVDDKHLEAELSPSVTFINLDRSQGEPLLVHDTHISVRSLDTVATLHHENAYGRIKAL